MRSDLFKIDMSLYDKKTKTEALILCFGIIAVFMFSAFLMVQDAVYILYKGAYYINTAGRVISFDFLILSLTAAFFYCYKYGKNAKKLYYSLTAIGIMAGAVLFVLTALYYDFISLDKIMSFYTFMGKIELIERYFSANALFYLTPALLFAAANIGLILSKKKDTAVNKEEHGIYGSAKFADLKYLKENDFYDENNSIFGKDDRNNFLRHEICNRTIIATQGGGKTVGVTIPALLTEDRPCFVHDPKGELWAVTAGYRAKKFNRKIITIDPYGVTKQEGFNSGKSKDLLITHTVNPFDYFPSDIKHRDRFLTSFLTAIIKNSSKHSSSAGDHFTSMAKTVLGGVIEFLYKYNHDINLMDVFEQLLVDKEEIKTLTTSFLGSDNLRVKQAGLVLDRAGKEEGGSIFTTIISHLEWLADANINKMLLKSNCKLKDFIDGEADIYIIMPEDQIAEKSSLVKMLLSIVKSLIIQSDPSKLSKEKYLFLLDELGQLGYNPDIESSIEILRARKCIFWNVFQSYSQIQQYKKPDLFISAKILQILDGGDQQIMQLIEKFGGKQTLMIERSNSSSSSNKITGNIINNSSSHNIGTSTYDIGTELIHANEIREMASDRQLVFIPGKRVIKCKKIKYFTDDSFSGYDINPLESSVLLPTNPINEILNQRRTNV